MSTGTKIGLDTARETARALVAALGDTCERIEIAGSIRRGKPEVGDIEIVAIPRYDDVEIGGQLDLFAPPRTARVNLLTARLDTLLEAGTLTRTPPDGLTRPAWGEKYKKLWVKLAAGGWLQVDLFITEVNNWGAILTIRTGPADFSEALVTRIKHDTPYRQQEGYLRDVYGAIVPVLTEQDYFRLAGVAWVDPDKRFGGAIK